jgi:hypothetical protein
MSECLEKFWALEDSIRKIPTTKQRYINNGAPSQIIRLLDLGGGQSLGTTMERFARYNFSSLQKRKKGKTQTGHDHIIKLNDSEILVEQKSSSLCWGSNGEDLKFQHVEINHKWDILLLCGIYYTEIKFWGMNRKTFNQLVSDGKITNQGCKTGESSEGQWFYYSDVKESVVDINTDEDLIAFIQYPIGH